jgi:hypothetical protein
MRTPVKLFAAIRLEDNSRFPPVEERLVSEYGPVDHRSSVKPMDEAIHLVLLSFERLIDVDRMPEIQKHTRSIAEELSATVEAGHLENSKVSVRYEDLLQFRNGAVQFLPGARPHYQADTVQDFCLAMRQIYRGQLRTMCLLRR